MISLTKEKFWTSVKEKCPQGMDHFCKWIDEYKEKNNWNRIFNQRNEGMGLPPLFYAPKYHDLPIAMQIGIFLEFVSCSKTQHGIEFCDLDYEQIPERIFGWFILEEELINRNN